MAPPAPSLLSHARAILLGLIVAIVAAAGLAPTADAATRKAMWGPVNTDGVSQFPIYKDLGVDLFQYGLNWSYTAPTKPANPTDPADPAYLWPAELDQAVNEGAANGIGVLIMAIQTPKWANGDQSPQTPPTNVADYADFLTAVAKRYPTVRHFMVWGEPIRASNYKVTPAERRNYYVKQGNAKGKLKPFNAKQRAEAQGYARLVDSSYVALKALNRQNIVIGGNTTTSGDVDPFNWARYMRLRNGKPPRMDVFGHNPFGTRGPDLKKPQILAGTADMSDLDEFDPWVRKYQARAGRNAKLRLFISEYTAPTDVASFEFPFYVTQALQAKWLTDAYRVAGKVKAYGFGWIGLRDLPVRPDGKESRTGLLTVSGAKKPSYAAYKRLP